MKILFSSHYFSPSIGGIPTVSELLASEFYEMGHDLILITETQESDSQPWPFKVVRRPSPRVQCLLTRWSDVVIHNNISLRTAWPLLLIRRPWVIAHHTWIAPQDRKRNSIEWLKHFLLRFATNLAISSPIAAALGVPSVIVGNPYRQDTFRLMDRVVREKNLVFLGRLVSDKGVDLLIEALANLRCDGFSVGLTIIGSGPDEDSLRKLAVEFCVHDSIRFLGSKSGEELAVELNSHEILVVPSRWPEPFGIVALEGIACGCVVAGSEGGGLKEAIGPCGLTFESGNVQALTEALKTLLSRPGLRASLRQASESHLRNFAPAVIASKYLEIFSAAISGS